MHPSLGVRLLDSVLPQGLASDLPLVIAGAMGTGRTVLSLELAAASVGRGEPTVLLLADHGEGALQEASSLGLDLAEALELGSLALLEMDDNAADLAHRNGLGPLADALLKEMPDAATIIVDPVSALIPDLFDERAARKLLRTFLDQLREPGRRLVLTYDTDSGRGGHGFERAMGDLAAAYVSLSRGPRGHVLEVTRVRGPTAALPHIEFAIGAGGSYPLSPTQAPELPQSVAPQPTPKPGERERIVIALESAEERAAIQDWLADRYDLLLVNSGLQALSLTCTRAPRMLLIEPQLRGASGYEVLRALRSAGIHLPVLTALHHKARAVDRVRPLVLGATDVIAKPLNAFELLHRIRTLLQLPSDERADPTTGEAELLFMARAQSRVVSARELLEHAARARRIGQEFGFPSTLLALETESDEALEVLAACADHLLRVEDAFCALTDRRAAVLLVCTSESQGQLVAERIHRDLGQRAPDGRPALGWSAQPVTSLGNLDDAALEPDWSVPFKSIQWIGEPSPDGPESHLRLLARHS